MTTQRRATPAKKKPVARKTAPGTKSKTLTAVELLESRGAAKRKSEHIADSYAAGIRTPPPEEALELPDDATPLDVMLMAMRRAFMVGGSLYASKYAEAAAPYLHGKISTIELKNAARTGGGDQQTGPQPFLISFVDAEDGRPRTT